MGVCLGTLKWDTHQGGEVDKRLKEQLLHSAKLYNLSEADANYTPYRNKDQTNFTVEISGFNILWNGGKNNCDIIINRFLNEMQEKYKDLCHMEKELKFLPM